MKGRRLPQTTGQATLNTIEFSSDSSDEIDDIPMVGASYGSEEESEEIKMVVPKQKPKPKPPKDLGMNPRCRPAAAAKPQEKSPDSQPAPPPPQPPQPQQQQPQPQPQQPEPAPLVQNVPPPLDGKVPLPEPQPQPEFVRFKIGWDKMGRKKKNIRMIDGTDRLLFLADYVTTKDPDGYGKGYVIAERVKGVKNRIGKLCVNGKGMIHTLLIDGTDKKGREIAGIAFGSDGIGHKELRVLINYEDKCRTSSNKANRLGSVAYRSQRPEKMDFYKSRLAVRGAQLTLGIPETSYKSVKNFVLLDSRNQEIFIIYKSSATTCTILAHPYITPFVAFGIAIPCVVTK